MIACTHDYIHNHVYLHEHKGSPLTCVYKAMNKLSLALPYGSFERGLVTTAQAHVNCHKQNVRDKLHVVIQRVVFEREIYCTARAV